MLRRGLNLKLKFRAQIWSAAIKFSRVEFFLAFIPPDLASKILSFLPLFRAPARDIQSLKAPLSRYSARKFQTQARLWRRSIKI